MESVHAGEPQQLVGDKVSTVRGQYLPVRWISRQTFRRSGDKWLESVTPILVRTHAIADGVPRRDLYLSPTHRLLIDGVFIEAQDLVNGRSIVRVSPEGNRLAYYNLLLETHEAIFAEGAATASLQLGGCRFHHRENSTDNLLSSFGIAGGGVDTATSLGFSLHPARVLRTPSSRRLSF